MTVKPLLLLTLAIGAVGDYAFAHARGAAKLISVVVFAATMMLTVAPAEAGTYYLGARWVDGKTWHVYLETNSTRGDVWFRRVRNACSADDFRALPLQAGPKS